MKRIFASLSLSVLLVTNSVNFLDVANAEQKDKVKRSAMGGIVSYLLNKNSDNGSGGGPATFRYRIPDTGQTTSYTDTFGEDSDYTINPHSYTKLDASGNALPDSATVWAMVRDNVTRLIWENKTDDDTIHDKGNRYTWQNAQNVFIAQLNAANFGGHSDWRLPTVMELSMLVHGEKKREPDPKIDTAYFPYAPWSATWSSTILARNSDAAWFVSFSYGHVGAWNKSGSFCVRAVRGERTINNLIDNGDGTVTDTKTGLMWQQDEPGSMDWYDALSYCEDLVLAGHKDWRLPNRNELQSLVDYATFSPAINTIKFPFVSSSRRYWSSTTIAHSFGLAWFVNFSGGGIEGEGIKTYTYRLRAVRGGQ